MFGDPAPSHRMHVSLLLQEAYEDGAYLVRQGEPGNTMFVVQSGDVIATHRVTGEVGEGQEVGVFEPFLGFCISVLSVCWKASVCK